ncbi:MAG: FtsW/RodA/SpoVE family cell cycle protein [Planctomycetota bacterium]
MFPPLILRAGIVITTALLIVFGLLIQSSIGDSMGIHFAQIQTRWFLIALAAGTLVSLVPYRFWIRRAWLGYGGALFLLMLVPIFGVVRNNSKRWLELGISIQPSELMKIAFIVALARLLRFRGRDARPRDLLMPGIAFVVPTMLIFSQPDLGTALLFAPVALAMLFCSGLPLRQMGAILGSAGCFGLVGYLFFLKPYQQARILSTFFRSRLPDADRLMEGYQLEQSLHSIGIGGFLGQGLGEGLQNQLNALPYRQNDFIFAVVAEETGLIGCLVLFGLILLLLQLIFRAAVLNRDPAARLVCVGVGTLIASQSFVHVGVNLGIVPTTGMTLPLVSVGGTSLLTTVLGIALVLNIAGRPAIVFSNESVREQRERLG